MDQLPGDLPPTRTARQPECRYCDHEAHVYTRCHAELSRAVATVEDDDEHSLPLLCPCPPHQPTGIYVT